MSALGVRGKVGSVRDGEGPQESEEGVKRPRNLSSKCWGTGQCPAPSPGLSGEAGSAVVEP